MNRRKTRISRVRKTSNIDNFRLNLSSRRRRASLEENAEQNLPVENIQNAKPFKNKNKKSFWKKLKLKIINAVYILIISALLAVILYLGMAILEENKNKITAKFESIALELNIKGIMEKYKLLEYFNINDNKMAKDIESKELSYQENISQNINEGENIDIDIERKSPDTELLYVPFSNDNEQKEEAIIPIPNEVPLQEDAGKSYQMQENQVKIAIIIDDMGIDKFRTRQIINLNPNITVSFLPYSPDLDKYVEMAHNNGNEIMAHIPMQPKNKKLNPGPDFLNVNMEQEQIENFLNNQLAKIKYASGMNNHMGSEFTENKDKMGYVMNYLTKTSLFFVDSLTSGKSKGEELAKEYNIPYLIRDIFIDHTVGKVSALKQLEKAEKTAKKRGYAIAIGHPKDATIEALKDWIPTLPGKNIILVPASRLIEK